MEVKAVTKYVRVQPRKVRIIADEVRGKNAEHVASMLRYHTSKSAKALRKTLISAMANAAENNNLAPETLKIATIMIDAGPVLKRMRARAQGRGNRILKKTSHITVVVEDAPAELVVKPHGTKAKPRPTFGAPKKKGAAAKAAAAAPAPKNIAAEAQPVDETTDTDAEAVAAATPETTPEEATPVTESQAPEDAGSVSPNSADADATEADASNEKGAE